MQVNTSKLIAACFLVGVLAVLVAIHAIDQVAGMSPITLIVGFVIGNGNSAKNGASARAIIEAKPDPLAAPPKDGNSTS